MFYTLGSPTTWSNWLSPLTRTPLRPTYRQCGQADVAVPGCILGGYTGWVIPGPPYRPRCSQGGSTPAKRAPEAPSRGWSGWVWGRVRPSLLPHHSLRSGPLRWVAASPRANSRLLANKARFQSYFSKVSQNQGVSPVYVEKACHSPYFQNRLQKSALKILRFPFLPAFSHKELSGRFDPYLEIIVKTTKCRSNVHTCTCPRRGRAYPRWSRRQAAPGTISSCTQREQSPDILNEVTFSRFTGDYD